MQVITKILACLALLMPLSSCVGDGSNQMNNKIEGQGSASGQWGHKQNNSVDVDAPVADGPLLGALAQSSLSRSLKPTDIGYANKISQQALEYNRTGAVSSWRNPETGASGSFVPTKTYNSPSHGYCREYTQTITALEREEKGFGKACRKPDGSWEIIK